MKRHTATSDAAPRSLDRLIPQPELLRDYVPLDRSTIWRLVKSGEFPPPIRCGNRRLAWTETAIQHWIASRQRA